MPHSSGVTKADLRALFAGPPRIDANGWPRGSPLEVPPPHELPAPAPASGLAEPSSAEGGGDMPPPRSLLLGGAGPGAPWSATFLDMNAHAPLGPPPPPA